MNDILEYIKNFSHLINNENYVNLISIVVVAITTYYVTKYTTLKPTRLAIKRSQLENIYLPLYLVLKDLPESISKFSALTYSKKISNILDKNYVLAFPQLHQLNQLLKTNIINNSGYDKTLRIMKHQIDIDYELLKKALGYPSENFHNIYIRMTFKQKAEFIVSWLNALWLFIPALLLPILISYFENEIISILLIFLIIFVFLFALIKINKIIKNMND